LIAQRILERSCARFLDIPHAIITISTIKLTQTVLASNAATGPLPHTCFAELVVASVACVLFAFITKGREAHLTGADQRVTCRAEELPSTPAGDGSSVTVVLPANGLGQLAVGAYSVRLIPAMKFRGKGLQVSQYSALICRALSVNLPCQCGRREAENAADNSRGRDHSSNGRGGSSCFSV